MKIHKITIELSDTDYSMLKEIADASSWPLSEVIMQCIHGGMPPTLSKVPEAFHAELLRLNKLSDRDLMRVADGDWPKPKAESELHRKADFVSLRRTYAMTLLRWRGHPVSPDDAML